MKPFVVLERMIYYDVVNDKRKRKGRNVMDLHKWEYWISKLELQPHPEGGFYKQTYRSNDEISDKEVSSQFDDKRFLYTSIYFLLRSQDVSHFHRLQSDELWYYHGGSPLTIHIIYRDGTYQEVKLGINLENGEVPQFLVPRDTIFGSNVANENTFSLVGCMVAPGFDFRDFELFTKQQLLDEFPEHVVIIDKLGYDRLPND